VSGDHIGKVLEFLQQLGAMLLQIRTRVTLETALREIDETLSDDRHHQRPRAICLHCCDLTMPVPIKRGEPCCISCSPLQATSASPTASCISPWLPSARRIERTPPTPSVRCSTRPRRSSPALACAFASQYGRRHASGLPSPARRPSAPPPRPLPRPHDRRQNRTFLRYAMSGGLTL
jgi:hypothetical protein